MLTTSPAGANALAAALSRFDLAADHLALDPGLRAVLAAPQRETTVRFPVVTSTSQSLPSFSVSRAALVSGTPLPGRNSIAQGVSKSAISVTVKGRSGLAPRWAEPSDWHAAHSAATNAACKTRLTIRFLPLQGRYERHPWIRSASSP